MDNHEKMRTTLSELCQEFTSKVMEAIPRKETDAGSETETVYNEITPEMAEAQKSETVKSDADCATT